MITRKEYDEYMQSDKWQFKRQQILTFWDYRCCLCFNENSLHVHHRTYESLGNELITDCIILCNECHDRHHKYFKFPEPGLIWLEKAMELCNGEF